jgi:hypothetical protein
MTLKWTGPLIIMMAFIFACEADHLFDYHMFAQSKEELFADGVGVICLALGLILLVLTNKNK